MSLEQKKLLTRPFHYPTPENGHSSQTNKYSPARILSVNPETLVRTVEDFLVGSRNAVVMEDGAVAFDLAQSKYSISGERNKCVLHLWSSERNVVRRVIEAEVKNEVLRLEVQRQGQAGKVVVEGLSLLVPPGTSALVRERMAHLHREAAKWRLYEFDEPEDRLKEIDVSDRGNIATRLVHWTDERAVRERFAESV